MGDGLSALLINSFCYYQYQIFFIYFSQELIHLSGTLIIRSKKLLSKN